MDDVRRRIPGTDRLLSHPRIAAAGAGLGHAELKSAVHAVQQRARDGLLEPDRVVEAVLAQLPGVPCAQRPVINASGVLLHTNLGRAPLSDAAVAAVRAAAGTTDVELDLDSGGRGHRGDGALHALAAAVPAAGGVHAVNNGAAALALAATALAAGREIVLARGELVEIGDGFRIPELLESTGARIREVGTTNRVTLDDYATAIGPETGFVLKVHTSNFVVSGFTASVGVAALAQLDAPVVADIGSGLLRPSPQLPNEPDATSALSDGARLVTASGDKLLGGPQAGLLLGDADLVGQLRRHPLARALRMDKLGLAALEATLRGPASPTASALATDDGRLRDRAEDLAARLRAHGVDAMARDTEATVGGGGAPGVALSSAAVTLPVELAKPLRTGDPAVLGRVEQGRLLLDLRAVPPEADTALLRAVLETGG